MFGSLNKVMLIGNLGKDPEIRTFNNGGRVCSFSIACEESWKDRNTGERKSKTEWVNCSVFADGLIGLCEKFLKKGHKVYLEGKIQTRKWQDQSGNDRYSTEVVVQNFNGTMLSLNNKRDDGGSGGGGGQNNDGWGGGSSNQKSGGDDGWGGGNKSADNFGGGGSGGGSAFDSDLDDDVPFISADPAWEHRKRRVL